MPRKSANKAKAAVAVTTPAADSPVQSAAGRKGDRPSDPVVRPAGAPAGEAGETAREAKQPVIIAYKGFNADMSCRGYRFALGQTYHHEGRVVACESGFHACEQPLNVFKYYPPATSRYAEVALGGETARHTGGDTKIAAAEITIKAELKLPELIERAVRFVFDRATWVTGDHTGKDGEGVKNTRDRGAATASGYQGAATASGYQGAATASGAQGAATASGDQGAATATGWQGAATATGDQGAATATGDQGAATASGDQGAATASGYQGAATATGWQGAATASGYQGAATASGRWGAATASGTRGAATASGYQGAATASGAQGAATATGWQGAATASGTRGAATASGYQGAATASGAQGAATATGFAGKARGAAGNALFLVERDTGGEIKAVWAGIAGRDGIRPDTFYRLVDGKPVEVE